MRWGQWRSQWSQRVQVPDNTTVAHPEGFDMVVHNRTTFQEGDIVFYWAALPQSLESARKGLSAERRAFGPDHANQGVTVVEKNGWCTVRLKSPRPYVDAQTGEPVPRQFHMRRARRGQLRGWTNRTRTVVLNPSRRLFRTLQIQYCRSRDPRVPSMWVNEEPLAADPPTDLALPTVARSREHAAQLMAKGRVSIFLPASTK